MKVVFLCRLYSPHQGGVEKHVQLLSKELINQGHSVTVVTEQFDLKDNLNEDVSGVRVVRIPRASTLSKWGIWSWMLKNKDMFAGSDIVHVHDVFWWYLPLRFILLTKPIFTTFHGYEQIEGPKASSVMVRKISEWLSFGSIGVGSWMEKWYGQKVNRVTYGAASAKPSSVPKQENAVFIGRLDVDTGIMEYVSAILKLGGKYSLDIFGDGALKDRIREMIKDVRFIKLKGTTENPGAEFRNHRFVFSSQYLSMLEAQQVGRQVFSYVGYPLKRDYLKSYPNFPYLICFDTADELVTKIKKLELSKEKRHIELACKWASKQTWKKLANMYKNLWQPYL